MTKSQREMRAALRREKAARFAQETGVYFAAVLGVFVSRYWVSYRSGTLTLDRLAGAGVIIELIGAAVGGFVVQAYILDRGGASAGKRARWKERMGQSFLAGFAIDAFIGGL